MNDNEIIKIFEEHVQDVSRLGLDGKRSKEQEAYINVIGTVLDLIKRQKTEIERYEKENGKNFNKWKVLDDRTKKRYAELYKEAKVVVRVEAVKEFAERLKATPMRFRVEHVEYYDKPSIEKMVLFIDDNDIDNLVKEMVGEG